MSINKDSVRANLIINKDIKKRLEEIAKEENRSFNNLVNTILQSFLREKEE